MRKDRIKRTPTGNKIPLPADDPDIIYRVLQKASELHKAGCLGRGECKFVDKYKNGCKDCRIWKEIYGE